MKGVKMKKVLLLSCVFTFGNACATEHEGAPEDFYSGFYAGAGVSFSRTTNKSDIEWTNFFHEATKIQNRKVNSAGGSVVLGYGRCFANNYYVGGELSVDMAGNKSYTGEYDFQEESNYHGKVHGVIPSAAVRLGYRLNPLTMAYVKGGIAHVKSDFTDGSAKIVFDFIVAKGKNCSYSGSDVNISKVVPVIGVGIERKVTGNFGLRLEGDYRFKSKGTSVERVSGATGNIDVGLSNRISGFTVRAMGTYRF